MITKGLIKNFLVIFLLQASSTVHAGIDDFINSLSTGVKINCQKME